jgi:hypothetical protein
MDKNQQWLKLPRRLNKLEGLRAIDFELWSIVTVAISVSRFPGEEYKYAVQEICFSAQVLLFAGLFALDMLVA